MTEAEWETSSDAHAMMEHLRGVRYPGSYWFEWVQTLRHRIDEGRMMALLAAIAYGPTGEGPHRAELADGRKPSVMTCRILAGERNNPVLASLTRCIFGHPFRPIDLSSACRTPTVAALAKAIRADDAFDRLPILADALEEAGCSDPAVLRHCRSDAAHARGCWVVGLILGRT